MKIGNIELKNNVVLAPMAGVTDLPFRNICRDFHEGLMVSEMVSVSALYFKDKKTKDLMRITDREQPMSLQVFTADPEKLEAVADVLNGHNHLILDINMGCPAPKIVNNGEGSALMKNIKLAERILKTAVRVSEKPVTVKFRKGWDPTRVNAIEFAKMAEASGVAAIAIHGRTRDQMYAGSADWDIIRKIKEVVKVPVIGNGDVFEVIDAKRMKEATGCDGIMIGRGIMGNPWLLKEVATYLETGTLIERPNHEERLKVALAHYELLRAFKGDHIATLEMRKHAAWYFKGLKGSGHLKNAINKASSPIETEKILREAFSDLTND